MISKLRSRLRQYPTIFRVVRAVRHPILTTLGFLYGAYLTLRYIDQYQIFPAVVFRGGLIRLRIVKGEQSQLVTHGRLVVEPWLGGRSGSSLFIGEGAKAVFLGDFVIGDDVRITLFKDAKLLVGGKDRESGSGITARSVVLVYRYLEIGRDSIVAWDTFITDCDWHPVEEGSFWQPTSIGRHVWVGAGAKVLKGVMIGDDSIVGSHSVVTSGDYPPRSLLLGAKAKVAKTDIPEWRRDIEVSHSEDT